MKLDGTSQMQGNLQMNNRRMLKLPEPQFADEPVTKKYLRLTNSIFYNEFLDLQGNSKMRGNIKNIKMNDNRITGLTNPPDADDEATNKNILTKIFQKPILNHHILQQMFSNISWMM